MRKILTLLIIVSLALTYSSCKKGSRGNRTLLPNVTGAAGEVVVVLNSAVINDSTGNIYKRILGAEYPMLPQSEPIFSIAMIPTASFSDLFKHHRNIILNKVGEEFKKAEIVIQRDVWAAPQTVLNIVGPTYPAIDELLKKEGDKIVQILEQAERDRVVQNAIKYEAEGIRAKLEKNFNLSMYFPNGYKINRDTTGFIWVSNETPTLSQGIIIYEYPYSDANTFTVDYLVNKRNEFVNKYIQGPTAGSYMTTETIIAPVFSPLMFKGRYFGQLRGLWDVHAHPMGGPFISLTTIDEERNRVITVEGYVYAPKFSKRNYLRQVEALLLTLSLTPTAEVAPN